MPGHAPGWESHPSVGRSVPVGVGNLIPVPSTPPTFFSLRDLLSHPTLSPPGSTTSHIPAASPPQSQSPIPPFQHSGEPWGLSLALLLFQEPGETQQFLGSVLAEKSEQMVP